jgi:hypothetical protein
MHDGVGSEGGNMRGCGDRSGHLLKCIPCMREGRSGK